MGGHARSSGLITAILAIALVGWPAAVTAAPVAAPGSAAPSAGATSTEWDETGFTTAGGYAPRAPRTSIIDLTDASVVSMADGSLLLTYVSNGQTHWERYTAAGALIRAPHLGVGVLPRPMGEKLNVGNHDVVVTSAGTVIAQDIYWQYGGSDGSQPGAKWGTLLTVLDDAMRPSGPPLLLPGQHDVALAASGDRVWAVTGSGWRVYLTELRVSAGQVLYQRQLRLTNPSGNLKTGYADIAMVGSRLIVGYEEGPCSGPASPCSRLRAAIVDPAAWRVVHDVLLAGQFHGSTAYNGGGNPELSIGAAGGTAVAMWRQVGDLQAATIDPGTGKVTLRPLIHTTGPGPLAPLYREGATEFALVGGSLRLLAIDPGALTIDRVTYARFRLFRWDGSSLAADPILLDGGFPIRADVLVELGAYRQNPLAAIVTRRSILEGAVVNRGLKDATSVSVAVSVAGTSIGTLSLGTLKPNQRKAFAIDWMVADTAAESVPVRFAATTASPEYTTGNNVASFTARIVQKGVIWGTVTDISADMDRDSAWSVGLSGATVCISGGPACVVTNANGFFRWDNLDFGTYSITATRPGFKPMGPQTVTISRPKPIGYVGLYTDNHGILRLKAQNELGQAIPGVSVTLLGSSLTKATPSGGTLVYDLPAGSYTFSASKHGFWSEKGKSFTVVVGQDKVEPLTLLTATEADLGGQVFDRYLRPVTDATVKIKPLPSGTDITVRTNAKGEFGPTRVPASPSKSYGLTATSPSLSGLAASSSTTVYGGDIESIPLVIAPSSITSLKGVSAIEGYTSWMVKASWPGFMSLPSAAMYAWFGNYIIRVNAQYWSDTKSIVSLGVAVQGGTYETHATTSEIDFTEMNQDYGDLFDVTKFSQDEESLGQSVWRWVKETATDAIDIGGSIKDLVTGDSADEAIITGQGPQVLTWKEAKSDFAIDGYTDIPLGFAIPICIGGSSEQRASVRVDRVDLVNVSTRQVLWSTATTPAAGAHPWFSWQGTAHENERQYSITTPNINYTTTAVYVWLRIGKTSATGGTPSQTAFEQRAEQVVIFRPSSKAMVAFIAPGDLYQNASMGAYGQ